MSASGSHSQSNGCKSQHAAIKFHDLKSPEKNVRQNCLHCCCCRLRPRRMFPVSCFMFVFRIVCVLIAGELSRHVPVGVMNSRNARINFSRCQKCLKSQVSASGDIFTYSFAGLILAALLVLLCVRVA